MKAELKTLSKEHADVVAAHLLAAASLVDSDPDLAFRHAEAAKRRAARLPVVREAAAETAYAAGRYEEALSEFRALRRMNGSPDYLPVLADCERALGRHQAALRLIAEGDESVKDPSLKVELRLVQAGVRADMGQRDEAMRLLRTEIESPRSAAPKDAQARLRYAYADLLLAGGDEAGAREWFSAAVRMDPEGQTDALDRLDELDGMLLTIDEDDLDDDVDRAEAEAAAADGVAIDAADDVEIDADHAEDVDGPSSADGGRDSAEPEVASEVEADTAAEPVETTEPPKPKRTRKKPEIEPEIDVVAAEVGEPMPSANDVAAEEPVKPKRARKKVEPAPATPSDEAEYLAVGPETNVEAVEAEAGAEEAKTVRDTAEDVPVKPKRTRKKAAEG